MADQAQTSSGGLDAKLEAEIEAAIGDVNLDDMLDLAEKPATATPKQAADDRQRKSGRIVNIHNDQVFVEFGPRSQGICPLSDFEETPKLGSTHEFNVDRYDPDDGLLVLSRQGSVRKADWEKLDIGQFIEARCTGTNKGGLEMEVANHRAFMPAGQVDLRHVEDLSVFIGEKMPCEVIEVDRKQGRIILSRKNLLQQERKEQQQRLLADLEVGRTMPAVITSLQPYGAFADLGGLDGLIHISDLSHKRIKHPSEAVTEGEQVNVQVLKIDLSKDPPKVGLGLKQTMEDPFEATTNDLTEGATVSGRVTRIESFGAFVELAAGVEGLVHISELSHDRINRVSSVVKPDEVITVQVLTIDPKKQRISLSLKALQEAKAADPVNLKRPDDPHMKKLKAQLAAKFGDNLKGGIG